MRFDDLSVKDQISVVKNEVSDLFKNVFQDPSILTKYLNEGKLTKEQIKPALTCLRKFNASNCGCCMRLDLNKLNSSSLEADLEPFLEICQSLARSRYQ